MSLFIPSLDNQTSHLVYVFIMDNVVLLSFAEMLHQNQKATFQLVTAYLRVRHCIKICVIMMCIAFLPRLNRAAKRAYLIRKDLISPSQSPWRKVFNGKRDRAWVMVMGVNVKTFFLILRKFVLLVDKPKTQFGRPRALNDVDHLALTLHFLRSKVDQTNLALMFGVTQGSISIYLRDGINILDNILSSWYLSRIQWPDHREMAHLASLTANRDSHEAVAGVFGFMDGLKLRIDEPLDRLEQNRYFNGYTKNTECTNLLLFTTDGCISYANMNSPGTMADSDMAWEIYHYLEDMHSSLNFKIVADSAFRNGHELNGRILTPRKITTLTEENFNIHARITSLRQPVEWGMRSIQSVWLRLNAGLPSHNEARKKIINCCFRLHNLTTRMMDRNQIKTVFSPWYFPNIFAPIKTKERLSQYYMYGLIRRKRQERQGRELLLRQQEEEEKEGLNERRDDEEEEEDGREEEGEERRVYSQEQIVEEIWDEEVSFTIYSQHYSAIVEMESDELDSFDDERGEEEKKMDNEGLEDEREGNDHRNHPRDRSYYQMDID